MKSNSGITIIEMTLYIGIVALISSSLVGLYIQIIQMKSKATAIQEVNESVRLAASRLDYEIRSAKSINSVGSSLSLSFADSSRNPTIFSLVNDRILLNVGVSTAYITSNLITITNFTLTNLSSGDSNSQNIRYSISGSYLGNDATVTSSAEVRSK
jgi:type II secretory pathway pseudopilin PulG